MYPIFFVLFFIILVFSIDKISVNKKRMHLNFIGRIFENKKINYLLMLMFFIFSVNYFIKYNLTFRHSGEKTLSGEGFQVIIVLALKSYFKAFLFFVLIKKLNDLVVSKHEVRICILISICYYLTLAASLDMLYIILAIILGLKFDNVLFSNLKKKSLMSKNFKLIVLGILVISIIFVGNANKIGFERAYDKFTDSDETNQIYLNTVRRISTWYISVMVLGEKDLFDNTMSYTSLEGVFNNTFNRLNSIVGDKEKINKDGIWSINRMNYIQIFKTNDRDITGASPGLIASFFYLPFFPLNIILMAIYTVFILRYFDNAFIFKKKNFTPLLLLILLFFLIPVLDSPLDLINIIGPTFIYAILFLGVLDRIIILNIEKLNNEKN